MDVNAWVALSEIFANILQDPNLKSTFLIIDALDECASDLPKLLNLIVEKSSESPHVKWVVSSRNWPNIEEQLETAGQKVRLCLELNEKSISAAVSIYIRQKVDRLARLKKYDMTTKFTRDPQSNGTIVDLALTQEILTRAPWFAHGIADRRVLASVERTLANQETAIRKVIADNIADVALFPLR